MSSQFEKQTVAAIVPAHNEAETIASVLKPLLSSSLIEEVIVISDGSVDETAKIANDLGANVIENDRATGKGLALEQGVAYFDAKVLLFADADTIGLTEDHIESLLEPVLSSSTSMNIGLRDRGSIYRFMARFLPLISGERALRREIFESTPASFRRGYMIETALNYTCRKQFGSIATTHLSGLKIRTKYEKVAFLKATRQYLSMSFEIVKTAILLRIK